MSSNPSAITEFRCIVGRVIELNANEIEQGPSKQLFYLGIKKRQV